MQQVDLFPIPGDPMGGSYPCSTREVLTGQYEFIVKKKFCGSVWCGVCFKRKGLKKVIKRFGAFDWERTRQITLTVDRKFYKDGEEAFEDIKDKGAVRSLIKNLKRTFKLKFFDWIWLLEWHEDGFPHWHIFIELEKVGFKGMIGGEILRKYWKLGRVTESYIRSKNHWKELMGYFDKTGHFGDEKKKQGELPGLGKKTGDRYAYQEVGCNDTEKV